MEQKVYVCLIGNDGCGKSTLCHTLNHHPDTPSHLQFVERSMPKDGLDGETLSIIQAIKKFDLLTYSYCFEEDWYKFQPYTCLGDGVKVLWIFLKAGVETLWKRIGQRSEMTIYEHPKCLTYFNKIYEEMCYFYGIPSINAEGSIEGEVLEVRQILKHGLKLPCMQRLTKQIIFENDIEDMIKNNLPVQLASEIFQKGVIAELKQEKLLSLYFDTAGEFEPEESMLKSLAARWIKDHGTITWESKEKLSYSFPTVSEEKIGITLEKDYFLQRKIEGESKILFEVMTSNPIISRHFKDKVLIILKGTIYSHTKQCTAEIKGLPEIRATGSMLFLEMLKRNHLSHSYISVNKEAIILSNFMKTNELEIVFKKQNLGTDKHSFHGLRNHSKICLEEGEYKGGVYIRFDWRNPNHQYAPSPDLVINLNRYYYVIENQMGKDAFFRQILSKPDCKPIGDKCISKDLLSEYVDTGKAIETAIEAYCVFQYYANEVGLEILDGCMMLDQKCETIWSEINPDCLRVKSMESRTDYDKDIWRAGGSGSKEKIIEKWGIFNQIFIKYFITHRFMDDEMKRQELCKQIYAKDLLAKAPLRPEYQHIYRKIARGKSHRRIIGTIDLINGEPILVQSSIFKEKHSKGSLHSAWDYISILPQLVIVDIDGASGKENSMNLKSINNVLGRKPLNNIYGIGGGIRDMGRAQSYLSRFPHIIISSNLDLLEQMSKEQIDRVIVQLSVNEQNEVLTHARTVNTGENLIMKMRQISQKGVTTVSITFNSAEGRLKGIPRDQLTQIMFEVPGAIKNVIIAGGITSLDDLQFLWGFEKCVPQLGSAIWKKKITLGQIYRNLVSFDEHGLVGAVIKSYPNNHTLGLIYMNEEAIQRTCEQRELWRFSRKHKRVMKKGESSGNIQKVLSMSIDCDNDSLLITVSEEKPIFCHLDTKSCFHAETVQTFSNSLPAIQHHINQSKGGYAEKVQRDQHFAISKIIEEAEEMGLAENKERKIEECADLMAHLLMYMNSQGMAVQDVTAELNRRSNIRRSKAKEEEQEEEKQKNQEPIRIGLGLGKHTIFIERFLEESMGLKIQYPSEKKRCYKLNYQIMNEKFYEFFPQIKEQERELILLSVKPKDMLKLVYKGKLDYGVNYSNIVVPFIGEEKIVHKSQPIKNLKLGLIKRVGHEVDLKRWSEQRKGVIISEYPAEVSKYMSGEGIASNCYTLIKVSGHSESYLNDPKFDLCDAIIQTGKTLEDNNLEAHAILEPLISAVLFRAK